MQEHAFIMNRYDFAGYCNAKNASRTQQPSEPNTKRANTNKKKSATTITTIMLRTFRSNPALGGFGSHDAPSDAVCQIIKELVDNAVDACGMACDTDEPKRVRVVFEPTSNINNDNNNEKTLRVTITDNGCGMSNIEECVGAFHSSKAQNAISNSSTGNDTSHAQQPQTAGRYGIGLTLCLLHAQRLVADSCASIQSATSDDDAYSVATVVVDTQHDAVRCLLQPSVNKNHPDESGTAISLLLPGGDIAAQAWPRLAEYFARYTLSLGLQCSLQVLAPTLSRVPLYIRPVRQEQQKPTKNKGKRAKKSSQSSNRAGSADSDESDDENSVWQNGLGNDDAASDHGSHTSKTAGKQNKPLTVSKERLQIWKATSSFLGRPVELCNVAHEMVPIRIKKEGSKNKRPIQNGPRLEVDVIVHGPNEEETSVDSSFEDGNDDDDNTDIMSFSSNHSDGIQKKRSKQDSGLSNCATLTLVRMVNKIPLMDSSEAIACGLVQGLSAKKRLWNSFGLDVRNAYDPTKASSVPIYEVRDSEQVAPFFKSGAHNLLEEGAGETNEEEQDLAAHTKAKNNHRNLLPAAVRLGNILVIVQIHAEPSTLPLPTLSKGRLPADNKAIDDAMEVGLTKCLQQLQKSNPNLLLTAAELRRVERDIKYVPALSLALASIVSNAVGPARDPQLKQQILSWRTQGGPSNNNNHNAAEVSSRQDQETQETGSTEPHEESEVEQMGRSIEERLRLVLSKPEEKGKKNKASKKAREEIVQEETEGETSEVSSIDDLASLGVDWSILDDLNGQSTNRSEMKSKKNIPLDDNSSAASQNLLEDLPESNITPKTNTRAEIVSPEDDNGFYTDW